MIDGFAEKEGEKDEIWRKIKKNKKKSYKLKK